MASKKLETLSACEWKLMRLVWEFKECDSRLACQRAKEEYEWADSTTKTFLRRLVKKGYLHAKRVGTCFLYKPARSSFEPLRQAVDNLLAYAKEETVAPLVAHIVKKSKLSRQEIHDLRALLDQCEPADKD
ncbi:MAG: BlaI/MecI/CopY family transcriptional regulator [Candidatus Hinthialibacter sp.]